MKEVRQQAMLLLFLLAALAGWAMFASEYPRISLTTFGLIAVCSIQWEKWFK